MVKHSLTSWVALLSTTALVSCSSSSLPTASTIQTDGADVGSTQLTLRDRTIEVTTTANSGPGSLRNAIDQANSAGRLVEQITIEFNLRRGQGDTIFLTNGLSFPALFYTNSVPLTLNGNDTIIDGSGLASEDILRSTGGADLTVNGLSFVNGPANGLNVSLPAGATDVVDLAFNDVTFEGNGLNGLLVNDQAEDEVNPGGSDSNASIHLDLINVNVLNNGFAALDFDGVRINEGGEGDLRFTMSGGLVDGNGGDGIELDEVGDGSVLADLQGVSFSNNGSQNIEEDPDDGFDIDEAGSGDIILMMESVTLTDNEDEGLDLDEDDAGNIEVVLESSIGSGNIDENFKFTENGRGNLRASFFDVTSTGSVDSDGVGFEEDEDDEIPGRGGLFVLLVDSTFADNDGAGIKAGQFQEGRGILSSFFTTLDNNGDDVVATNVAVIVLNRLRDASSEFLTKAELEQKLD